MTKKARSSSATTISSSESMKKKKTKIRSSNSVGVKYGARAIFLFVVLVSTGLLVQVWNTPSTTTIIKSYLGRGMGIGVVEGRYLRDDDEAIHLSRRLLSDTSNSTSTTNSWIQRFMNWLQKMIQQRFGKPSRSTSNADSPITCGNTTCHKGEYCCNEDCGICTRIGAMCINVHCNSTSDKECETDSDCPTIYCVRAPCPHNVCTKDKKCELVTNETDSGAKNETSLPCKHNRDCPVPAICDPTNEQDCKTGKCDKDTRTCIVSSPITGVPCGNTTCGDGEYCCNKSCGMCAKMGVMCILMSCSEDNNGNATAGNNRDGDDCQSDADCPVINCIKAPCPEYVCGANNTCVLTTPILCGDKVCPEGDTCCNPSCGGHCAKPGEFCSDLACISPTKSPKLEKCGNTTCGPDEFCCNESCGICAPVKDGHCIEIACVPPASDNTTQCGKDTCTADEYCCNESCGTCLNKMMGRPCIGGICTNEKCNSNFDCPPPKDCFTDVCPRSFCVDGFCRRLPSAGGGTVSNTLPVTVQCGDVQCPYGKVCCNPSCGVCTFPHEPCTLQACVNNGA